MLALEVFLTFSKNVKFHYHHCFLIKWMCLAVILEHFDQVVGDCFMDCVNCLIGFANNKCTPRISLKAIALLRICEDRLAEVRMVTTLIFTSGHLIFLA